MLAHLKISYRRPSLSFRCVDINSHYKSRHCATETCQKLFCKSIMTVLHSARSYVQPLLHLLLSCLCLWRQFYDLAITVASSSVSLLAFKVKIELFYITTDSGIKWLRDLSSSLFDLLPRNQDESSCDQPPPDSHLGGPREPVWSSASRACRDLDPRTP